MESQFDHPARSLRALSVIFITPFVAGVIAVGMSYVGIRHDYNAEQLASCPGPLWALPTLFFWYTAKSVRVGDSSSVVLAYVVLGLFASLLALSTYGFYTELTWAMQWRPRQILKPLSGVIACVLFFVATVLAIAQLVGTHTLRPRVAG